MCKINHTQINHLCLIECSVFPGIFVSSCISAKDQELTGNYQQAVQFQNRQQNTQTKPTQIPVSWY